MKKIYALVFFGALLAGCTWSFQQIDTHGTATDLLDEQMSTTPTVSPDIDVPISAIPAMPSFEEEFPILMPPKEDSK